MGIVLTPPSYRQYSNPSVFLAGPIQGADNWQQTAAGIIHSLEPNLIIANPRRDVEFKGDFSDEMYNEQVDWETHHLRDAANYGTILLWLAKEDRHDCGRAYAQTSRFELGEWFGWYRRHHLPTWAERGFAIGIEDGFSGGRYIKRRIMQDLPHVPVHNTLEDTCAYAARLIRKEHGVLPEPAESPFEMKDHWLNCKW
jgi:hypothetical protein